MNLSLTLWTACLAAVSIIVNAHPQGGSSLNGYCGHLMPALKDGTGHKGIDTKNAKFEIKTNETALDVGESVKVTVKKSSTGNEDFMGFLCIVILGAETSPFTPTGVMSETNEAEFTTTVECKDTGKPTGASHYNKEADPNKRHTHTTPATFVWTAPAYAKKTVDYKLRCTIVESKLHSYTGYEKVIQVKQGGVAPTSPPSSSSAPGPITTTQKSSSPRNMASGFIIVVSIALGMERSG